MWRPVPIITRAGARSNPTGRGYRIRRFGRIHRSGARPDRPPVHLPPFWLKGFAQTEEPR